MATAHDDTVRTLLTGDGISPVYTSHLRELDAGDYPAVFVVPSGGPAPSPFFGAADSYKQAAVQITVVGQPGVYSSAESLARDCYDAVDHKTPSGYTAIRPRADILSIGVDENDRPIFTINVLCQIVE